MAKVAIVGCGAMGSVYAALMVDAGHDVHAVTLWADHAEAMRSQGLRARVRAATGRSGSQRLHDDGRHRDLRPRDHRDQGVRRRGGGALVRAAARGRDGRADDPERPRVTRDRGSRSSGRTARRRRRRRVRCIAARTGPRPSQRHGDDPLRPVRGTAAGPLRDAAAIWESAGFKVALFDDIQPDGLGEADHERGLLRVLVLRRA